MSISSTFQDKDPKLISTTMIKSFKSNETNSFKNRLSNYNSKSKSLFPKANLKKNALNLRSPDPKSLICKFVDEITSEIRKIQAVNSRSFSFKRESLSNSNSFSNLPKRRLMIQESTRYQDGLNKSNSQLKIRNDQNMTKNSLYKSENVTHSKMKLFITYGQYTPNIKTYMDLNNYNSIQNDISNEPPNNSISQNIVNDALNQLNQTESFSNINIQEENSQNQETPNIDPNSLTTSNQAFTMFPKVQIKKVTFNRLKYSRKRTYQPYIDTNWKFKSGLTLKACKESQYIPCIMDNMDNQEIIISEHSRLLLGNIDYFKQSVVHDPDFDKAFAYVPLQTKIKFNKSLEETIGILLLLPQLLLNDFYHFIEKFDSVKFVDKKKLCDSTVYDENECFIYNNSLLTEMVTFYTSAFEVYKILVKEIDNMALKPKQFLDIITILEKARFNISFNISCSKNAIKVYNSDATIINKVLKEQHKKPLIVKEKENLENKIRSQFMFKQNEERQKKIRVENILKKPCEENKGNSERNKFNSIIGSKLISNLFKYCNNSAKEMINTDRIQQEFKKEHKKRKIFGDSFEVKGGN